MLSVNNYKTYKSKQWGVLLYLLGWLLLKMQEIGIGEDIEQMGPLYIASGNVKWYILKNIVLTCDAAVLLLGT